MVGCGMGRARRPSLHNLIALYFLAVGGNIPFRRRYIAASA